MGVRNSFLIITLIVLSFWLPWYALAGDRPFEIIAHNWPIATTMIFGSMIAGATSEGGGAVAFPVFTKLLNIAPLDAKIFSLAIQSVGMGAASIAIVTMRIPVEWRAVFWAGIGGIAGIYLGAAYLATWLSAAMIKMTFTAMASSFAVTLCILNGHRRDFRLPALRRCGVAEKGVLLITGVCGGIVSGIVGNGIDIMTFSVLVLLYRLSEKVATPTSVVLMAMNAWVGFYLHYAVLGGFTATVQGYWLAAIPVVVVGAPLGALFCSRLSRETIARILIGLIAIELVTSILLIPITRNIALGSALVVMVFAAIYAMMYWFSPERENGSNTC